MHMDTDTPRSRTGSTSTASSGVVAERRNSRTLTDGRIQRPITGFRPLNMPLNLYAKPYPHAAPVPRGFNKSLESPGQLRVALPWRPLLTLNVYTPTTSLLFCPRPSARPSSSSSDCNHSRCLRNPLHPQAFRLSHLTKFSGEIKYSTCLLLPLADSRT
jgi:hypothetical protein